MTLSEYVQRRNGVPIGSPRSLRNNLHRSLGAKNFSVFWHYWNPIFGFYLGKKIFQPLRRYFPSSISLIITFVFCGMIHDLVTAIFKGKTSLNFSLWFFCMSIFVLTTKYTKVDFSGYKWGIRAIANISALVVSYAITIWIKHFLIQYIL
jgi:hypothetical protein